MTNRTSEDSKARSMRVSGVGTTVPSGTVPPAWAQDRRRPSRLRGDEERERRHRERAIAAWLRSLSR